MQAKRSGLPNKLLAATGTADADLTSVSGDTNPLLAVGAAEIAVIPIPKAS